MKKLILALSLLILTGVGVMAQSTMTDQQLISFILEEHEKGSTQSEIVSKLLQRGVDIQQIQRVRRKYERQIQQAGMGAVADEAVTSTRDRMRQNNGQTRRDNTKTNAQTGTSQRITGTRNQQQQLKDEDPDFLMMQAELGGILPVDSIALLEELLEERNKKKSKIYGHDIFNNETLSFESNMNIATPQDYRLGPGDAVAIEIYGASQESIDATITPDGYVTIDGYGPVQLAGLTVAQANARLRSQVGSRYSDSQIRLSVGQTRTITVNVMGEVEAPGTYTLSAFSTVMNALYMAQGVTDIGTLRNIKVYRNNRLVSTVDVYDYILNGRATGNVKLTDNDVIIVGSYENLVNVTGRVKRPMFYEMKTEESLGALLKYAGGFAGDAYRKSVRVMRKSGALYSVHTVDEFDFSSFHMADGDSVSVDSIVARYSNMVEIKGAVFHPGMYQVGGNITSVRSLIEVAGGMSEDAFSPHGVMHRMKEDRTLEVLSVDIAGIMEGRVADVPLRNEDVLYVPTRKEKLQMQTLTIHGEVQYPGIYKYAENETLEDFVLQAGGLTDAASMVKVDVARRISDPYATNSMDSIAQTFSFALKDGFVIEGDQSFHLEPFDEVYIRKSPGYATQQNVYVEGEVLFEGTYTLSKKGERLSEIIQKAGGLTKTAYANGARLIRQRTAEEMARQEALLQAARRSKGGKGKDSIDVSKLDVGATYPVGIELGKALTNPGSDADIELREGDRIVVPEYLRTVKINGEVMYPNTTGFIEGKSLKYYINQAGGYNTNAKKSQTYIIYMNGNVAKASRKNKPAPGCEIVVPTKQRGNRMSTAELLTIGSTSASIATMIATLVNLLK
ncbi:MAG: SLBB domain-containing protein [Prevotella sp.]|nr:SLBB domain-containing protein [Prevotella sp.]